MANIFTEIEEVDREILLRIPNDNDLLQICSRSAYSRKVCNDAFWEQRFIRKYNVDLDEDLEAGKKSKINYQELYKKLMDKSKYEILIFGSEEGYLGLVKEMIRAMIQDGLNIRANIDQALVLAAEKGHLEIVRYLLERGANWKKISNPSKQVQLLIKQYGRDW